MSEKIIYMYATLPRKGEIPFGGGEVGNMRTIRMLENDGFKIIPIRQRKAKAEWGKAHRLISYPFRIFSGWIDVFTNLALGKKRGITHLSGFAGKTIYNEYVIMHIMKLFGYNVIYELRGGGAKIFWDNGSKTYRKMFKYLLDSACHVFVQGKEYVEFIESISGTPVYHYANCVEKDFAPASLPVKPSDRINLLFYGRCEEDKHVELIVDVANIVQEQFPITYLTIAGNGNTNYINKVKQRMQDKLAPNTFKYLPGLKHEDVPKLLSEQHFYIFPSTQPREGQSNSVTECMCYGIIPIASPQGFNRSTVGDDSLIIDALEANQYASKIIDIINNKKLNSLSYQVYNHFRNNFSQDVVFGKTVERINKIYSSWSK